VAGLQVQQLVQSGELGAGLEFRMYPRQPSASAANIFLITGIGAVTPLSQAQAVGGQTYEVTSLVQNTFSTGIYQQYASQFMKLCPSGDGSGDIGTTPCYVAFYPQDRSRFFRNYSAGLRMKFWPSWAKGGSSPGIVDATIGQNEYVTGGSMRGWVAHVGGATPLSYLPGLYIFGGMDVAVTGSNSNSSLLLLPTTSSTSPSPSTSNTINIVVPPPNRDRYVLGIGWDIAGMIEEHMKKDRATSKAAGNQ